MSKPLYGCQFEECATEVSYPADMLRLHNGKPVCEFCYDACDITDDMVLTRDEHGDPDELREFRDLPPFVPEHDQRIAELGEERDRLRGALAEIREIYAGSEGIPVGETAAEAYVVQLLEQMFKVAAEALAGGEGHQ